MPLDGLTCTTHRFTTEPIRITNIMIRWPRGNADDADDEDFLPSCLCVEPEDGIIVTARASVITLRDVQGDVLDEIDLMDAVGQTGCTIGLRNPDIRGVAASGGNLLLADTTNACCVLLESEDDESGLRATILYDHVLGLGPHASSDGSFQDPTGVAFGNGQLLCVDSGNQRVNVFDAQTGSFMLHFGPFTSQEDQEGEEDVTSLFDYPVAIAFDHVGNEIYVVDQEANTIHVFDGDNYELKRSVCGYLPPPPPSKLLLLTFFLFTTSLVQFGRSGSERGEFLRPVDIAILSAGKDEPRERTLVIVADQDNHRVQVLSRSGKPVWICDSITIDTDLEQDSQHTARLESPFGVAVDLEGDILVADRVGAVWITPYEGIKSHAMERELDVDSTSEMVDEKEREHSTGMSTSTEELEDRDRTLTYEELRSQRQHDGDYFEGTVRREKDSEVEQDDNNRVATDTLNDLDSSLPRRTGRFSGNREREGGVQASKERKKTPRNTRKTKKKKGLPLRKATSEMFSLRHDVIALEQEKNRLKGELRELKEVTTRNVKKANELRDNLKPHEPELAQNGYRMPSAPHDPTSPTHQPSQKAKTKKRIEYLRSLALETNPGKSISEICDEILNTLGVALEFKHSDVAAIPDYSSVTDANWLEERALELRMRILTLQQEQPKWTQAKNHIAGIADDLESKIEKLYSLVPNFDQLKESVDLQGLERTVRQVYVL